MTGVSLCQGITPRVVYLIEWRMNVAFIAHIAGWTPYALQS